MSKPKTKTVVISRKKWATPGNLNAYATVRGCDLPAASLYDSETGFKCCLGFVCRALRKPLRELDGVGMPYELESGIPLWLEKIQEQAARINDSRILRDKTREQRLVKLFKDKTPIRLRFKP